MITSSSNAQVKQMIQLNKKAREAQSRMFFWWKGLRMFREVPRERLVKTYVSESFLEDPEHQVLLQGIPYEVVKDSVFAQMSDTLTPQGVLTVVRQYHYTMEELMGEKITRCFSSSKICRIREIWERFSERRRAPEWMGSL